MEGNESNMNLKFLSGNLSCWRGLQKQSFKTYGTILNRVRLESIQNKCCLAQQEPKRPKTSATIKNVGI